MVEFIRYPVQSLDGCVSDKTNSNEIFPPNSKNDVQTADCNGGNLLRDDRAKFEHHEDDHRQVPANFGIRHPEDPGLLFCQCS